MPELPEVETVRRTLGPRWIGRSVVAVRIARADFVRRTPAGPRSAALGAGGTASDILRHGKQMAVVFDDGRAVHLHLGMSGQVFVVAPGATPARTDHVHIRWTLDDGSSVLFRDPRRFGGVWAYASVAELASQRWDALGPDALSIGAAELRRGLGRSSRAIKACLLDQAVLAGVGNIYADEALFAAGISPHAAACDLSTAQTARLALAVRTVLRRGVQARGSTLRDFVDADHREG
ncbi:MAG: Fpg/Nei family DNA glycosylase, partial [Phycisphaerales bacterium JB041]